MPDRIRLQPRASVAASQSFDLSIRAHGADSAPGEHTAAFRGVNAAGVDELTGVRRALSHGGSSSVDGALHAVGTREVAPTLVGISKDSCRAGTSAAPSLAESAIGILIALALGVGVLA